MNRKYYAKRASEEEAKAAAASSPEVGSVHLAMSKLYAERASTNVHPFPVDDSVVSS